MQFTSVALVILGLFGATQAECPECENFLGSLGAIILSEDSIEFQIEYLQQLFCENEDAPPGCADRLEKGWPIILEIFSEMDNVAANLCSAMGSDQSCIDWEESTSDVDICANRVADFTDLSESDVFGDFISYVAPIYCGILCEDSDESDCIDQCVAIEEQGMPVAFKSLCTELEIAAEDICEDIV